MAVKKSEIYSALWASCDALRGGMDASQYKDYVLTLLFVKYVSDKFKGQKYPTTKIPEGASFDDMEKLVGDKNIGEGIDKVIAKLAEANNLRGVIDNAHFNDENKLGKGQEMVAKLGKLVKIFSRPELDFKNNKAEGDDIIGDAYEYLMRKFATEGGKSKGQFYTPAEVSRVLSKIIGIQNETHPTATIYDPACGSGSLLIKALDEAPLKLAGYGQEKDTTTAGLAIMNCFLHGKDTAEIFADNTFSNPHFFEDSTTKTTLARFDYIVANPPFSLKNWKDGLKNFGRFDDYEMPPDNKGDYAWLLHILKSLRPTGKAAVILPHGVLFRGNAEESIRRKIIDKGYIKGIISLPPNLFYGTSIAACIIVLDKATAENREHIFIVDASRDFIKDGNKNRLRERDIYKITSIFNAQDESDPTYAKKVPLAQIIKNGYNLNIPRYINNANDGDSHDLSAHLNGGIPAGAIENMRNFWEILPNLKTKLFAPHSQDYYALKVAISDISESIFRDSEFLAYKNRVDLAFSAWQSLAKPLLKNLDENTNPKELISTLSSKILELFAPLTLLDKYDIYQILLAYWQEIMSDDIYVIIHGGFEAGREIENDAKGKNWDGLIIPKILITQKYFANEAEQIANAEQTLAEITEKMSEMLENAEEGSEIFELNEDGKIAEKALNARIAELGKSAQESAPLLEYKELIAKKKSANKTLSDLQNALNTALKAKYEKLEIDEIKDLAINDKWLNALKNSVSGAFNALARAIESEIATLAKRYERTLGEIEAEILETQREILELFSELEGDKNDNNGIARLRALLGGENE